MHKETLKIRMVNMEMRSTVVTYDSPSIALARQQRNSHTVCSFGDPCRAVRFCVETPRTFLYHASSPMIASPPYLLITVLHCMHKIRLYTVPVLPRRLPPRCTPIICSGLQAFFLTRSIPRLGSPLPLGAKTSQGPSQREIALLQRWV